MDVLLTDDRQDDDKNDKTNDKTTTGMTRRTRMTKAASRCLVAGFGGKGGGKEGENKGETRRGETKNKRCLVAGLLPR